MNFSAMEVEMDSYEVHQLFYEWLDNIQNINITNIENEIILIIYLSRSIYSFQLKEATTAFLYYNLHLNERFSMQYANFWKRLI